MSRHPNYRILALVTIFVLAAIVSAVAAVFGVRNLTATVARCGMSLGCERMPREGWVGLTAVATPFVVFAIAAICARTVVAERAAKRSVTVVSALAPVAIMLFVPVLDSAAVRFVAMRDTALVARLRKAPIEVTVLGGKLARNDARSGLLRIEVETAGLPQYLSSYEYLIDLNDLSDFAGAEIVVANRVRGDWRFFLQRVDGTLVPCGHGDKFAVALEFIKQRTTAIASPRSIRVRLTLRSRYGTYAGGSVRSPEDMTFFDKRFIVNNSGRDFLQ